MNPFGPVMKVIHWYGRVAASLAAGFISALALCLVGGRLAGSHNEIIVILLIVAVPFGIAVAVVSYKILKPPSENRR